MLDKIEKIKQLLIEAYEAFVEFMRGVKEVEKEREKFVEDTIHEAEAAKIKALKDKINQL